MTKLEKPISKLITLQAITFLHPGSGQTTGIVDLPVQREVHTGYPMFAASGFKGSLRDKAERQSWEPGEIRAVFGGSTSDDAAAGALSISDARILAFPVRSLQQVFVWVTAPQVLKRLQRDSNLIGVKIDYDLSQFSLKPGQAITSGEDETNTLMLEELSFELQNKQTAKNALNSLANSINELHKDASGFDPQRLVMISDDDFQYLVKHATQISARIKLNEQKTTTGGDGNLWYEETMPPETIMYALALCHAPRSDSNKEVIGAIGVAEKLVSLLADNYLQIGGNETVGQGWCYVNVAEVNS